MRQVLHNCLFFLVSAVLVTILLPNITLASSEKNDGFFCSVVGQFFDPFSWCVEDEITYVDFAALVEEDDMYAVNAGMADTNQDIATPQVLGLETLAPQIESVEVPTVTYIEEKLSSEEIEAAVAAYVANYFASIAVGEPNPSQPTDGDSGEESTDGYGSLEDLWKLFYKQRDSDSDRVSDVSSDLQNDLDDLTDGTTDFSALSVQGDLVLGGALEDSLGNTGTSGYVLQSTGTGIVWVATSTLGITASSSGGGGGLDSVDIDTSAELRTIVGDEAGSGALVFANSPTLITPSLGTPSTLVLTNATGLPLATGVTGTLGDSNIADAITISGGTINNSPIGASTPSTAVFTSATSTNLGLTRINMSGDSITDFTGTGLMVQGGALTVSTSSLTNINADLLDGIDSTAFALDADIGTTIQAYDADLSTYSGITPAANTQSLLSAANYAAMRALLDLEAGTDFYSVSAADTAFEGELNDSAGLAAALSDETGTGLAVFSASPTFTGTVTLPQITATNATATNLGVTGATTLGGNLNLSGSSANIVLGSNYLSGDGDDEGVYVQANGNLSIGTSTDLAELAIHSGSVNTSLLLMNDNSYPSIVFSNYNLTNFASLGMRSNGLSISGGGDPTNVSHIYIADSGNVGIGTSTPSQLLAVGPTTSSQFLVSSLGVVSDGAWQADTIAADYGGTGLSTISQNQLLIGGAGNTWTQISTSSLGLSAAFTNSAGLASLLSDESGSGVVAFTTSPAFTTPDLGTPSAATLTNATGLPVSTGISGLAAGVAAFLASPTSANLATAVTDESGNAGSLVFTASPTFTGTVSATTIRGGSGAGSVLTIRGSTAASPNSIAGISFGYGASAAFEAMKIVGSTGYVGIGTSSPNYKLAVAGTSTSALSLLALHNDSATGHDTHGVEIVANSSDTTYRNFLNLQTASLHIYTGTSSAAERMTILSNGNVGIGTTSPSAQFTTTGSVRLANFGSGSLQTDADGNVSVSSDERLKDITGEYEAGLEAILTLKPITYHWNVISGFERSTEYAGFSAQNVQASLPAAVGEDKRGYLTLSDRTILAAVVNSIKELWAKLQIHDERLQNLEEENALLKARLEKIEEAVDLEEENNESADTEDKTDTVDDQQDENTTETEPTQSEDEVDETTEENTVAPEEVIGDEEVDIEAEAEKENLESSENVADEVEDTSSTQE